MPRPIHGLTAAARAAGFSGGGHVPTGAIRHFVGQYHVSTPALTVARDYWHRSSSHARPLRRAVLRAALKAHAANRALYAFVMRGR